MDTLLSEFVSPESMRMFESIYIFGCKNLIKFAFIFCLQIPQIIMLTFDGAVNLNNYEHYKKVFNGKRKNPNGCDIKGTFFIAHEYRYLILIK